MSDPVPAVTEAGATGEIADIFADIRHVYQVGVVNLVWRHLATFPGALPWVWQSVKPAYVDSTHQARRGRLACVYRAPGCPYVSGSSARRGRLERSGRRTD